MRANARGLRCGVQVKIDAQEMFEALVTETIGDFNQYDLKQISRRLLAEPNPLLVILTLSCI